MSHVIFFVLLGALLLIPVVLGLFNRPEKGQAKWPKPPTDDELYDFHRQVNRSGSCARARD